MFQSTAELVNFVEFYAYTYMKRILLSLLGLCCFLPAFAQMSIEGKVEIDAIDHDFGEVFISNGPVSHSFNVKNISAEKIVIYSVVSSCGCTDVKWTRDDIAPGKTGVISATYSNDEGPYPFDKTLTAYISDVSRPVIFHLRGTSLEKSRPLKELYPLQYGSIGLKDAEIKVGNISQGEQKNGSVKIANLSGSPVKLSFKDVSKGLTLSVSPNPIPAGSTADLRFNVTADGTQWGSSWYFATPLVNGKEHKATGQAMPAEKIAGGDSFLRDSRTDIGSGTNRIGFKAFIKANFSNATREDKMSGPSPYFASSNFSFGRVKAGQTVQAEFVLTNKGKKELEIYSIDSECSRLKSQKVNKIAPGKSSIVKMELDTNGLKKGEVTVIVNLTTNSPVRPLIALYITGFIN